MESHKHYKGQRTLVQRCLEFKNAKIIRHFNKKQPNKNCLSGVWLKKTYIIVQIKDVPYTLHTYTMSIDLRKAINRGLMTGNLMKPKLITLSSE